jgi:hypothetical protein
MRFPAGFPTHVCAVAAIASLLTGPVRAEGIELKIVPKGSAASGRPLPPGASPLISVELRNREKSASGPVEISVRLEGLAAGKSDGWQPQGETLRAAVKSIPAGGETDRALRLRVEKAPNEGATARIATEAKTRDGATVTAEAAIPVRDCAGAYRTKLAELRESLSTPVRDAAEAMRREDAALPMSRLFPYAGRRNNELARVERVAGPFAARRGSDAQMQTEWFRFMIQRWGSELNAYASQPPNPGLCANNYYQIAGYRQGLLPITKHIETTQAAADKALELARKDSGESGNVDEIARALAKSSGADVAADASAFAVLARLQSNGNGLRADPALVEKLSTVETAAWLADADARGQKLIQAIEQVLATIAGAHKESCTCAF